MWRALFLAIGVTACVLGAECLVLEKIVLNAKQDAQYAEADSPFGTPFWQTAAEPPSREIVPPEWAPWSLLSMGAVTIIYSFTVPKLVRSPQ